MKIPACVLMTCLGLALCEVLAKAHRGTLSVASEPGHGATFTLCLPLVEPA